MALAHTIGNIRYTFDSLRELLAKATPLRSGDVLAGVAAESAEERWRPSLPWLICPSPTSSPSTSSPTKRTKSRA
jgi:hypothetical protein